MTNRRWFFPPKWVLASLLLLLVTGCNGCSEGTNPSAGGKPSVGGIDVAPEPTTPEGLATVGSYVPPQIRARVLSADGSKQTEQLVSNALHVRIFNDDEVVAVGASRLPVVVDPQKRLISMLAHTCSKPSCAAHGKRGRPILFTQPYDQHQISPEGKILQQMSFGADSEQKRVWGPPLCPICGRNSDVQVYILPEVAPRLARLKDELKASRQALDAAQGSATSLPPGVRPPVEILNEINSLPQLYVTRQLKGT